MDKNGDKDAVVSVNKSKTHIFEGTQIKITSANREFLEQLVEYLARVFVVKQKSSLMYSEDQNKFYKYFSVASKDGAQK